MSKYKQFIFEDYIFDAPQKKLMLQYSFDGTLKLSETYHFDFDFAPYNQAALNCALHALFIMAGVSYFKAYMPSEIVIKKGMLSPDQAAFFAKTYQKGLGEFFYINKLSPETSINFPSTPMSVLKCDPLKNDGLLIGLGGGKDSLVSVELLRKQNLKLATWSVGHKSQLTPLVETIGLPHFWVKREWDKKLLELNTQDALNGHIPISAIFAAVGTVVAILSGFQDVAVSNESSSSEPNLEYEGVPINHQYSKSIEFEQDYQKYLQTLFGDNVHYYSFLRPLTEVRIAELFAKVGFDKYKGVFSSCNRAFTHDQTHMSWCGECSKCAFVFLALTPFVERKELEILWGGKNLLLDPKLEPTYRQLLGIKGNKPLDCVGEVKESRAAMHLAQKQYPELAKYEFDIPDDYDYKKLSSHHMPDALSELLHSELAKLGLK